MLEALAEHRLANNVVVVRDGVAALEHLRREGPYAGRDGGLPAALLLDIKMPRMDGIEVLEAVRSDDTLKTLPVVMLTSSREDPDLKRCYALGVNAYVVKPRGLQGVHRRREAHRRLLGRAERTAEDGVSHGD